jgi:hypothetical protein
MKLVLNFYGALCETKNFKINDIDADYEDFGDKYDHDSENAESYCCADMEFDSKPATQEILDKYHITVDEYNEICDKLEEGLSFGRCGWCE